MQRFQNQIFLAVLCVFFSCGNKQNNTPSATINDSAKEAVYGKNNHKATTPNPAVLEITNEWGAYNDFAEDVLRVNRNTLDGLKTVTDRLVVSSDSISRFIPDTLNTRPISSRLIVLKTRIKLLQQELGFDRIDSSRIEEHISEINNAHTYFVSQMNEKFIKDGINQEQKEVEDREIEKRKRDSIFKAELMDNNRN